MSRSVLAAAALFLASLPAQSQDWMQWGRNSQHLGTTGVVGQRARHILEDIVVDPFIEQEKSDPLAAPELLVHYQVPILEEDNVYMEFRTGTYTTFDHWETQIWNEKRLQWKKGHLQPVWNFQSDWKPVPYASTTAPQGFAGPGWQPVFHAALSGNDIYIPGAGGSIFKVNKNTGRLVARISPFGPALDRDTYSVGPPNADNAGNVYYQVIKLNHNKPWDVDVVNSWLVKVLPNGTAKTVTFASLTPDAPKGNQCLGTFDDSQLPWPPSPDAVPPKVVCGGQRPGINIAPVVAPNGTIYVVSVAHLWNWEAYLIAVNPDLTLKWDATLRDRLTDGCNVYLPPNGTPGGCREGAHTGVDPAQNRPGAGRIFDDATSSPVVAPDGSIFFGAFTRYNWFQGHLMKFAADGSYKGAYQFGWDITPSIRPHGGTYSVILKDNHYAFSGSYCDDETLCPANRADDPSNPEAYYMTQLDENLNIEWRWQNTNPLYCVRNETGQIECVNYRKHGWEFCVNAPAVDRIGNVYQNSEDGNLYVVRPDGTLREHLFLDRAQGAAYTPISIGADGRIYTQNNGHLFVVGGH